MYETKEIMNDSKVKVSWVLKTIKRNSKIEVAKWRKLKAGLKVSQKNLKTMMKWIKVVLTKSEELMKG